MIPRKLFGRTAHESTRVLFGAAALWSATQSEADEILDLLLQYEINHIDTAASYGDAELRIGPWMDRHRDRFFLASKTEERRRQGARDSLHRSLELLHTDHLDLFQIHNLATEAEWEIALGPGGALEAFVEARQQGLVRFIGVTGHGTGIAALHRRALERFDFDSVLLPYNYPMLQNPQYAADVQMLFKVCRERNTAIQTIKSLARREWGEAPPNRNTWYAPLEDEAHIRNAVGWVLGESDLFLNSVGDMQLLPKVLKAADTFQTRPTDEVMQGMLLQADMEPLFK